LSSADTPEFEEIPEASHDNIDADSRAAQAFYEPADVKPPD
jgi:hypothetical protein